MKLAPFLLRDVYDAGGAVTSVEGKDATALTLSTRELLLQAAAIAKTLPTTPSSIGFFAHRSHDYLRCQWAIWLADHIAVPLSPHNTLRERAYIIQDSCTTHVLVRAADAALLDGIPNVDAIDLDTLDLVTSSSSSSALLELLHKTEDHDAMLMYTSGTTGDPKGVLSTHASLHAQMTDLTTSWEFTVADRVLHFLPLHHTHGILNNLNAPLFTGAHVEFLPSAAATAIWTALARPSSPISVLMAVPSVYMLLLEAYSKMESGVAQAAAVAGASRLRLAISGSMACPVSILTRWQALTGTSLLERYGMTECGMALGNPLHGVRHVGYVGQPFPSIEARVTEEGALQVRGPTLFKAYWNRPEDTTREWTADGWFKTGDVAEYNAELGSYRILGRASVDILKSAGYKLSALEIERAVLEHPQVRECAVYGVSDETWGQLVTAVVRANAGVHAVEETTPPLVAFLQERLAKYKIPRKFHFVDAIPKNAMGKVNKKSLPQIFDSVPTNA
ncbi:Aste57867_15726 [Aphanomyces stellatus]|uniref:Aste57867_15726 protein n=1 Tax=Aphanomyces stellatus TaxID=120398 RepID=A0A485L4N7_9STRA|nr:hypothetical protein As57867_015670 [Aphanomyces stellatus]VFT92515.1 Aste57867_15726 [Aphanomyces stellatus]